MYGVVREDILRFGAIGFLRPTIKQLKSLRTDYDTPIPIPVDVVTGRGSSSAYVFDSKGDFVTI